MTASVTHEITYLLFARAGVPPAPHDLWNSWTLEPSVLLPLLLSAFIYLWGTRKIWSNAGLGRGITLPRFAYFLGANTALVIALISPLDALSDALFSAHMVQHLLLMLIAAPLLVLCDFPLALSWALPRQTARELARGLNRSQTLSRSWQFITSALSAWLLFALALWLWHAPAFFEAALKDESVHTLEHVCFFVTGMLFWWALLRRSGADCVHYGMAIPYLFTSTLHSGILGALMIFTSRPWYPYYADRAAAWGFTPLQDQQLAGLIMWIPGGLVFTLLTIIYFAAWLRALEEHVVRLQQSESLPSDQELQ